MLFNIKSGVKIFNVTGNMSDASSIIGKSLSCNATNSTDVNAYYNGGESIYVGSVAKDTSVSLTGSVYPKVVLMAIEGQTGGSYYYGRTYAWIPSLCSSYQYSTNGTLPSSLTLSSITSYSGSYNNIFIKSNGSIQVAANSVTTNPILSISGNTVTAKFTNYTTSGATCSIIYDRLTYNRIKLAIYA